MFLDPIFIRFLEVAFCLKKSNFIQTALRDLTKKAQFLSKHVMRDLGVLSGVLTGPQAMVGEPWPDPEKAPFVRMEVPSNLSGLRLASSEFVRTSVYSLFLVKICRDRQDLA